MYLRGILVTLPGTLMQVQVSPEGAPPAIAGRERANRKWSSSAVNIGALTITDKEKKARVIFTCIASC